MSCEDVADHILVSELALALFAVGDFVHVNHRFSLDKAVITQKAPEAGH